MNETSEIIITNGLDSYLLREQRDLWNVASSDILWLNFVFDYAVSPLSLEYKCKQKI